MTPREATGADHALPPVGAPATRALRAAGITDLDALARHTSRELLGLHGVGPRAIRILGEALSASGRSFAASPAAPPAAPLPDAVQSYVDALDPAHRALFDRLQAVVLDELPEATVVISYRIPLYRVGKRHVGLNAGRRGGVTLTTTSPDHIAEFARRYPEVKVNRASIAFGFDDDVADDDIRAVVRRAVRD